MKAVLHITDAAQVHLQNLVSQNQAKGFRFSVKEAGCSGYRYVPDLCQQPESGDLTFLVGNLTVFVPEKDLPLIESMTIDLRVGTLGQTQLTYHNPRAADHCGCGESFSLKDQGAI
jgi:iron-sulfur cluster assembly protein